MTDKELEACLMRGYGYRKTTELRGEYIVENHKVVSNTLHEVTVWERDRSGQQSWEEYEAQEAERCEHGVLPEEYCADCNPCDSGWCGDSACYRCNPYGRGPQ